MATKKTAEAQWPFPGGKAPKAKKPTKKELAEQKAKEQEKKEQENSQYKRDESELKTEINFTNVLMKDSSSLIRESLTGQEEIEIGRAHV